MRVTHDTHGTQITNQIFTYRGIQCNCAQTANQPDQKMTYRCRIPVSKKTRDCVKARKRGGETYDELLRQMVKQYDPSEAKN